MRDLHLLCAGPGTDPAIQTLLASATPGADRLMLPRDGAGPPVDFTATFYKAAVAFGETDLDLGLMGIASARAQVPAGWYAYIKQMTIHVPSGTLGDIAALTAKLFHGGTEVVEFGTVVLDVQNDAAESGGPATPYELTTSPSAPGNFDVRVTTNGTSGSLNILATVIGTFAPNS